MMLVLLIASIGMLAGGLSLSDCAANAGPWRTVGVFCSGANTMLFLHTLVDLVKR